MWKARHRYSRKLKQSGVFTVLFIGGKNLQNTLILWFTTSCGYGTWNGENRSELLPQMPSGVYMKQRYIKIYSSC